MAALVSALRDWGLGATELKQAVEAIDAEVKSLESETADASYIIERVDLKRDGMQITLNLRALLPADRFPAGGANLRMTRLVPMQMRRRGVETRVLIPGEAVAASRTDVALLRALARGHQWFGELASGTVSSTRQIASREGVSDSYVRHIVPLGIARSIDRGSGVRGPTRRLSLGRASEDSSRSSDRLGRTKAGCWQTKEAEALIAFWIFQGTTGAITSGSARGTESYLEQR